MEILFANPVDATKSCSTLIVGLFKGPSLTGRLCILDQQSSSFIQNSIAFSSFECKFGSTLQITTFDVISDYQNIKRIILVGLGDQDKFNLTKAEEIGAKVTDIMLSLKIYTASVMFESFKEEELLRLAFGCFVKSYKFNKYKTADDNDENEDNDDFKIKELVFASENHEYATNSFANYHKPVLDGISIARDLVTEPANILNTEEYCNRIKDFAKSIPGLKAEILDEKAMQKLGMNALLGVGQGSSFGSKLAVIRWDGAEKKDEPYTAFVGKGVTFDTGGVSLKPPRGMWEMIYDMAGSAAVVGAMCALAQQKTNSNVVGVVGIVENAISAKAQRPGDIVKSASGKTIEVLNTDAEGRLVLADALWYTQKHFDVKQVIDVATLTGAIVVALGNNHAGLFSNDDQLSDQLIKVGSKINEPLWRIPLSDHYNKLINSDVADVKNISTKGYGADSITAAQFLQRFVEEGIAWAHLDIAGVASDRMNYRIAPKGASGFGVRLLTELVCGYYSDK